jgi:hypothetical protein
VTIEVTTLSQLERWRRRSLIKTIEKIVVAAESGLYQVRLLRLFARAGIINPNQEEKAMRKLKCSRSGAIAAAARRGLAIECVYQ